MSIAPLIICIRQLLTLLCFVGKKMTLFKTLIISRKGANVGHRNIRAILRRCGFTGALGRDYFFSPERTVNIINVFVLPDGHATKEKKKKTRKNALYVDIVWLFVAKI
jgi:hypothetical protein